MKIELQDKNSRAAGPLVLLFGGAFFSVVIGAIAGNTAAGVVASPIAGWCAIEIIYMFPAWVERRVLPLMRSKAFDSEEIAKYSGIYKKYRERTAETLKTDETPRRVDLGTEYTKPEYTGLRPKKWKESENATILD